MRFGATNASQWLDCLFRRDGITPTVTYNYDAGGASAFANSKLTTVASNGQIYTRGYDNRGRVNASRLESGNFPTGGCS